jgi:outer membrane protein
MSLNKILLAGAVAVALTSIPMAARAETLTQALANAYTNNPNIASALLAVKSASENIALRKAGKLPTIGLSANVTDAWQIAGGTYADTKSATLGLGLSQTIFDNNQTDAQVEQARALTELAEQTLRNSEQTVLLSVVSAYMAVVRDSQLVKTRQDTIDFYRAQVKSANDRLQIGEGTKIDVSQAQARLATGIASYTAATTSLASSQASYQRWVGHKPKNLSEDFRFAKIVPKSIDEAIAIAQDRHPAILSARAAVRAAQSGTDAARAAFGPSVDLAASVGATTTFGSGGVSGSTVPNGAVKLSLSVPLYAGGALGAGVRKANIDQIKSETDVLSTVDQVREAVITSWSTMQNAAAQIDSAQSAVQSGQLVLEGVIQERDVGQQTTLDVLNAQADLTSAREGLITASASRVVSYFSVIASVGRLSAKELGLPVTIKSADGYVAKVEDVWQELRSIDE